MKALLAFRANSVRSLAWRQPLAVFSRRNACPHEHGIWRHVRGVAPAVEMDGFHYCLDGCLESALANAFRRETAIAGGGTTHRLPIGLLLLSRGHITVEQLRSALDAQQRSGTGRIGEWLQTLGFADEWQITAALARQSSCAVLRQGFKMAAFDSVPKLPQVLMEEFRMVPVEASDGGGTIHLAFGDRMHHAALYAIERMMGCRTVGCMAVPSVVDARLQELGSQEREHEIVFPQLADISEFGRIVQNYCLRVPAQEVRYAVCEPFAWARILMRSRDPIDLLMPRRKAA